MTRAHFKGGVACVQDGDYAAAVSRLTRALEEEPRLGLAYAWRGVARLKTGRSRGALADFDSALRLDAGGCAWIAPCLAAARQSLGLPERPDPRTSLVWRRGMEPRWKKNFSRAAHLFDRMEYRTVVEGVRPIMFRNVERGSAFVREARRDGLAAETLFHVKRFSGFAHRHVLTGAEDADSFAHVVVARRPEDAEAAAALYRRGLGIKGHSELGRLLGFPACCRQAFESDFVAADVPDPLYESALRTAGVRRSPRGRHTAKVAGFAGCNVLLRYFGARAVSWIPCAFDCRATKKAAGDWLHLGRGIDPEAAESLIEILSMPARWTCDLGRVSVRTPIFEGSAPSFAPERPRAIDWRAR